jgi:hypothetical protein
MTLSEMIVQLCLHCAYNGHTFPVDYPTVFALYVYFMNGPLDIYRRGCHTHENVLSACTYRTLTVPQVLVDNTQRRQPITSLA